MLENLDDFYTIYDVNKSFFLCHVEKGSVIVWAKGSSRNTVDVIIIVQDV